MFVASAFGNGHGFAPSVASVGAATAHNVNILWQVGLVILTFVSNSQQASVFQAKQRGYAPVGAAVVTWAEKADIEGGIYDSRGCAGFFASHFGTATHDQNQQQWINDFSHIFHIMKWLIYFLDSLDNAVYDKTISDVFAFNGKVDRGLSADSEVVLHTCRRLAVVDNEFAGTDAEEEALLVGNNYCSVFGFVEGFHT